MEKDALTIERSRCTCAFIKKLGTKLNMQLLSQCTALVFFHRFFRSQTFETHDRFIVAIACVFLASKVEEDIKRIDDITKAANSIKRFTATTEVPTGKLPESLKVLREKVLLCERVLLHTMSFNVSITHPHLPAFEIIKQMAGPCNAADLNEYRQAAWNFCNDSLFSSICVRYTPDEIAVAAVLLAYYFLKARGESRNTLGTEKLLQKVTDMLRNHKGDLFKFYKNGFQAARLEPISKEMLTVYESPILSAVSEPVTKRLRSDDSSEFNLKKQ